MLSAVILDVDGTLADTERDGHRPAFNRAFAELGLDHRWGAQEYGRLLATTGGLQRLEEFLTGAGHPDPAGTAQVLHRAKTAHFLEWVRSGPLLSRPGVDELLADLRGRGVRLGVATTGRRAWVLSLLDRLFGLDGFDVVVTGDDVEQLKPAPDAYLRALAGLGVPAVEVLAVEGSPPGLQAARRAGLSCLVVTNDYTAAQAFAGAAAVLPGFDGLDADRCAALLAGQAPGPR